MAITRAAKKANRVALRKRVFNLRRKRALTDKVKAVKQLVAAKDQKQALAELALAYQAIDKAAKRGVINKNAAARKKSRLTKLLAKAK